MLLFVPDDHRQRLFVVVDHGVSIGSCHVMCGSVRGWADEAKASVKMSANIIFYQYHFTRGWNIIVLCSTASL